MRPNHAFHSGGPRVGVRDGVGSRAMSVAQICFASRHTNGASVGLSTGPTGAARRSNNAFGTHCGERSESAALWRRRPADGPHNPAFELGRPATPRSPAALRRCGGIHPPAHLRGLLNAGSVGAVDENSRT